MDKKFGWIPSLFIISGGLYTIFYLNHFINVGQQLFEGSSGLMRALTEILVVLSDLLYFPMFLGGIVTIIGVITIWKRYIGLAVISLVFALMLVNLAGVILSITGSVLGFIMWREKPDELPRL